MLKVPGKADDHLKNWADNANLQLLNLTYVSEFRISTISSGNIPFDGSNCVYLIGTMPHLMTMCR